MTRLPVIVQDGLCLLALAGAAVFILLLVFPVIVAAYLFPPSTDRKWDSPGPRGPAALSGGERRP